MSKTLDQKIVAAIRKHCADEPIVASATVRFELDEELGERRNHPDVAYNGAPFQKAEQTACKDGRLQRWKRRIGKGNVGWSPSHAADPAAFDRAKAWARRKGWDPCEPT